MPTFPLLSTTKSVVVAVGVDDAISKRREFVSPLFAWIANFANGVVVPTPKLPPLVIVNRSKPNVKNLSVSSSALFVSAVMYVS